ncbi:MAG: murein biosynthesis integral membrane protein MurJ [Paracoccaceae bacterium]
MIGSILTVGVWTLLSRVLGFARDIAIAATLGSGPVAEAFLVAFRLPNLFRRFFAEGAFNMAFVPMFSKRLETGDDPAGFAREAFSGLASVLIAFTLIGQIAMPAMVLALASGFAGDDRFDLAVLYGRIAFPYILFISLAALLSGVLNAAGRFKAAAAAPTLLNACFLGGLGLAHLSGGDYGAALAWAIPVAGVAQVALVWWAARRAGFALIPGRPSLSPRMKRLVVVAAPAMLAGGVMQINLIVGQQVASFHPGAIAWLAMADRLYQLPLGVVAIAIGVVLLPELSRRLAAADLTAARDAYNRATEFALALTVPAAVALVVIAEPLIGGLFGRGAFTDADVAATALAVAVYGAGLPAFVLQKTLQPLYFAREDTRTPLRFALVALVVNAVLAIGLAPLIGWIAAAWGTTLAGWTMVWLLWRGARAHGDASASDARLRGRLPWILVSAAGMGVLLWGLAQVLPQGSSRSLLVMVPAGIVAYFALCQITGALPLGELKGAMRRPPRG